MCHVGKEVGIAGGNPISWILGELTSFHFQIDFSSICTAKARGKAMQQQKSLNTLVKILPSFVTGALKRVCLISEMYRKRGRSTCLQVISPEKLENIYSTNKMLLLLNDNLVLWFFKHPYMCTIDCNAFKNDL